MKIIRLYYCTAILLLILTMFSSTVLPAKAQGANPEPESPWSEPANLSRSGGTTQPEIFVDAQAGIHVLWKDKFASLVYSTSSDGMNWSPPEALELPFDEFPYQIVTTDDDQVFVFWLNEDNDLIFSWVQSDRFASMESWSIPVVVKSEVFQFNVVEGPSGALHIAYLRTASSTEGRPGIYYTGSDNGGITWTDPALVYASSYLRTIDNQQGAGSVPSISGRSTFHVDIKVLRTDDQTRVLISWNNPSLKRVYFASSSDGGSEWQEPQLVDGPDSTTPYLTARNINLYVIDNTVLRLWHAVESGGVCTLKYQISPDGGDSWSPFDVLFKGQTSCPDQVQMFPVEDDLTLVMADFQSKVYLTSWNGQEWTLPEEQSKVSSFVDTENFNTIQLKCHQGVLSGDKVVVISCDEGAGGDIWQFNYDLNAINKTFGKPSGWSDPLDLDVGDLSITTLALTSDRVSTAHAIWSLPEHETSTDSVVKTSIYYARYNQRNGAVGPLVLYEKMEGVASQVNLTYGINNRLFAAWSGGLTGEIIFSRADADQAGSQSGWSPSSLLQTGTLNGREPKLTITSDGNLYAIYAIPLNEQRGVYLQRSTNGGSQWEPFVQVFLGAENQCDMVNQPSLAAGPGNHLFVQWTCSTLPGGIGQLGLFSSESTDGGQNWTPAEQIVSGSIIWNRVIATDNTIFRFWQSYEGGNTSLWQTTSYDLGSSWEPPKNISSNPGQSYLIDIVTDHAGHLYLTNILQSEDQPLHLQFWLWDLTKWVPQEELFFTNHKIEDITALASVVLPSGRLVVAYANHDPADVEQPNRLTFTSIEVSVSPGQADNNTTPVSQPESTSKAPLTPTSDAGEGQVVQPESTSEALTTVTPDPDQGMIVQPTANNPSAFDPEMQAQPAGGGTSTGLFLAFITSGLIISLAFGARLIWNRFRSIS
jgi:hypothetical protein